MKYGILFSILIFLCCSVLAEGSLQPFGRVLSIDPDIKKGKTFEVDSPVSGFRNLVSWEKKPEKETACLIYKVPSSETMGSLYFRDFSSEPCLIGQLGENNLLFKDIKTMEISEISLDQNPSFKVSLKQELKSKKEKNEDQTFWVHLPFYSHKNARWRGIEVYSDFLEKDLLKDGEICNDFDKSCNEVGENRCHLCEDKAFSTFTNLNCPSKVFGICGRNFCGGKDQYPCLKMTSISETLKCEDAEKHLYCQHGTELECTTGGKVICR